MISFRGDRAVHFHESFTAQEPLNQEPLKMRTAVCPVGGWRTRSDSPEAVKFLVADKHLG